MSESRGDLWTTSLPASLPPAPLAGHARHAQPVPVGRGAAPAPAGRPGWLLAALVAVGVAALLLGVVRCSAEQAGTDAAAIPAVPTAVIPGAGAAAAPTAPVLGSLTADSTSLFDAAQGDRGLVALTGETAAGYSVPVQSVPADEGFWIGHSATERVWVQFTTNSESAVTITPGQLLDLRGPVVPHGADFAVKAGVSAADGAAQLTREGAHIEVDPKQIKVVGTR